jgi:hypothetical protein
VSHQPQPTYKPCPECGVALVVAREQEHVCDDERRLDYQLLQLRHEIARFEDELATFLDTPQGAFALWCAERDRQREHA